MRRRIGRKRRGKKERWGEGKDCGDADEEEEREKDEEMRGRAADSGISRKVSAVSRRSCSGNRSIPWRIARPRNCESMAQNHRGTDRASRDIRDEKRAGISASPKSLPDIALNMYKINIITTLITRFLLSATSFLKFFSSYLLAIYGLSGKN